MDMPLAAAADLPELLACRLCHDLAGPLLTLAACLETGTDAEELALARECAVILHARLRLLRAAWGGQGGALGADEIAAMAAGLPGAERLRLDLSALPELDEAASRLVLNLLLLAAAALPAGGAIRLAATDGALRLRIDGARAGWPVGLEGGAPPASPRELVAPLLRRAAAEARYAITRLSATELRLDAA